MRSYIDRNTSGCKREAMLKLTVSERWWMYVAFMIWVVKAATGRSRSELLGVFLPSAIGPCFVHGGC
jgi:hypothetical protein